MGVLVAAMFASWLVLTLLRQLGRCPWPWSRRIARAIRRHDAFQLVPSFSYFAPTPPPLDFEVLYRDRLEDGSLTAWRALTRSSRSPWRAVWNPQKRLDQTAFTMCTMLLREIRTRVAARDGFEELCAAEAYVLLAQHVAAAPHSVAGRETQFLVAVSSGFDETKEAAIAFMSPIFRL